MNPSVERWSVPPESEGERLDRHLADHLDQPRSQVARWIEEGRVKIGEREIRRSSHRLLAGDEILCSPRPILQEGRVEPQPGALRILHEDPDLVVVDKPPGLAVHPGAGRPDHTLANYLLERYPEMAAVGGPGRPGIVHRLDRGTTGILVAARSVRAYRELAESFSRRQVTKRYLAVVYGEPRLTAARLLGAIGRHPQDRKRMTLRADGRPAETSYRTLASTAGVSLLELDLATGRTHQIRVHCKACRLPLVGDPLYGEARWKQLASSRRRAAREFSRPALHAWFLSFPHPDGSGVWQGRAPVPEDLQDLWTALTGDTFPTLSGDREWPDAGLELRELLSPAGA